jgi:hypothetical protein
VHNSPSICATGTWHVNHAHFISRKTNWINKNGGITWAERDIKNASITIPANLTAGGDLNFVIKLKTLNTGDKAQNKREIGVSQVNLTDSFVPD